MPRRRLPEAVGEAIPFVSRRRWSGLRLDGVRYVLGAPELFPLGELAAAWPPQQEAGRRVVGFGTATTRFPDDPDAGPPPLRLARARRTGRGARRDTTRDRRLPRRAGRRDRRPLRRLRPHGRPRSRTTQESRRAESLSTAAASSRRHGARPRRPRARPRRPDLTRRETPGRRVASPPRTVCGHGRRRCQRRARAEGVPAVDRTGLGHADGEGRRGRRARERRFRCDPGRWLPKAGGSSATCNG